MRKQIFRYLLAGVLAIAFAFLPSQGFSVIFYVDHNAAGANDGSTWTDAFPNLQDALEVAVSGDEIWVAQGVYKPENVIDLDNDGVLDPREAVFHIPSGVALYGGFVGTEMSVEERDWQANLTILSGDIDDNDLNADGNFIAESITDVAGGNSFHVIYTENADSETRLDEFVVTAGRAHLDAFMPFDYPNTSGGGWYNLLSNPSNSSSPTIANSSFQGNYAKSNGGAFYTTPGSAGAESSSLIENCEFSGNASGNSGGALYIGSFSLGTYEPQIVDCRFIGNETYRNGGAIYLLGDAAEISSSLFENNEVTAISTDDSTLPGSGGAVRMVASKAVFTKCMFIDNTATGNPTGAYEGGGGGAVYMSVNEPQTSSLGSSIPQFISCGFYSNYSGGNTASWGGAVLYLSDGGILAPFFVNCVFSDNEASNHGGAVAGFTRVISEPVGFDAALEPVFTNCTFSQNEAGQLGGAIYHNGYEFDGTQILNAVIENSILWGNTAVNDGNEIFLNGNQIVRYSLVAGSGGSGGGWDTDMGADGGNNTNLNPHFINPSNPLGPDDLPATTDDGLRLYQFSNAVNECDNTAPGLTGITEDYIGTSRIHHGVVDMGAYERSGFIIPNLDFVWILNWRPIQPPCLTCPDVWGFLLHRVLDLGPHYVWKEQGQFMRKGKSAILTGEIMNIKDTEASFKVHIVLEREHDWERWKRQQGTWFAETKEAKEAAKEFHQTWKFWTLSPKSYLEGTGKIKGTLKLHHVNSKRKTGFQVGMGANAMDADFGMAALFNFNGKLSYKGKKIHMKGKGTMNFDGIPCEENCRDQFLKRPVAWENPGKINKPPGLNGIFVDGVHIYPVPARNSLTLESDNQQNGSSLVKILDANGKVLKVEKWNRNANQVTIDLNRLHKGLHFIQVVSENGKDGFTKQFIKE